MATFRLGALQVDPPRNLIASGAGSWSLEPKIMDLLVFMASRPGEVLSRETLIDNVWKVEFGADESLTRAVSLLRKTFKEAGQAGELIETIPKRGYRLTGIPESENVGSATVQPVNPVASSPATPLRSTPRVAPVEQKAITPYKLSRGIIAVVALSALAFIALIVFIVRPQSTPVAAQQPSQLIAFFGFRPVGDDAALKVSAEAATDRMFQAIRKNLLGAVARTETENTPDDKRFARAAELGARYALSGELRAAPNGLTLSIRFEDVASRLMLSERSFDAPSADAAYLPAQAALATSEVLWCIIKTRSELTRDSTEILNLIADRCRDGGGADSRTVSYMAARMRAIAEADPDSAFNQAQLVMMLGLGVASAPADTQAAWIAESETALSRAQKLDANETGVYLARITLGEGKRVSMAEWDALTSEAVAKSEGKDSFVFGQSNNFRFLILRETGRFREALPHEVAAVANDPLAMPWYAALHRAVLGDTANARAELEPMLAAYGEWLWDPLITYAVFFGAADADAMLKTPPSRISREEVACMRGIRNALASDKPDLRLAEAGKARACAEAGTASTMTALAASAALGDLDGAFELAGALSFNQPYLWSGALQTLFWPGSRAMRADRRFLPLVDKLGLAEYWRMTKSQPDVCEAEDVAFCRAIRITK